MKSGEPTVGLLYNKANRVGTVTQNGTQTTQYTYDGFGQRLVKTFAGTPAAGTLFAYSQDDSLLEETNITGAAQADYIYLDGTPIGDLAPASKTLYYLHTDHLGTPQLATNSAKATEWQATYEPFGWGNSVEGLITQNLRLPGQYFDSETTSYHNGFRDYVAILGRYGQVDPIGLAGGMNIYLYANANPTRFIDRSGLCCGDPRDDIADQVAGIGIGQSTPAIDPRIITALTPTAAGTSAVLGQSSTMLGMMAGAALRSPYTAPFSVPFAGISVCLGSVSKILQPDLKGSVMEQAAHALTTGSNEALRPFLDVVLQSGLSYLPPPPNLSGSYNCDKLGYCQ